MEIRKQQLYTLTVNDQELEIIYRGLEQEAKYTLSPDRYIKLSPSLQKERVDLCEKMFRQILAEMRKSVSESDVEVV